MANGLGKSLCWAASCQSIVALRWRGLAPSLQSYGAALSATAWRQALELFEDLSRSELSPDLIAFNAAAGGAWRSAVELFGEAKALGLRRDDVSGTQLLSACEKSRSWTASLGCWSGARQDGLPPNLIQMNSLLTCLGRGHRTNENKTQ